MKSIEQGHKSGSTKQGSFFWLQNKEGEPVVGGWLQIHQPEVLPPYFAARKKYPGTESSSSPMELMRIK
jgi:hypothetical protein